MKVIRELLKNLEALPEGGLKLVSIKDYENSRGDKADYLVEVDAEYGRAKAMDTAHLATYVVGSDDVLEFAAHVGLLPEIPEASEFIAQVKDELAGVLDEGDADKVKNHPSYEVFKKLLLDGADIQTVLAAWLLQQAQAELYAAKSKPDASSVNRSEAQKDAYRTLAPGLKYHRTTGEIFITGSLVTKHNTEKKSDKPDTRKPLTRAKNYLGKKYLRTNKWRQFKLADVAEVSTDGSTITVS